MTTPTQSDLQKAREWLNVQYPNQDHYIVDKNNNINEFADTILSKYVLHLENIGEIQFTANRYVEKIGACDSCGIENKNLNGYICGSSDCPNFRHR